MKMICNLPYNLWYKKKDIIQLFDTNIFCEIVNLSPIRWLQDPLAEYKKNSDYKKFENIRKQIENIDVVPMKEAMALFKVDFPMDIGIYHITKDGGFDCSTIANALAKKILLKMQNNKGGQ